MYRVRFEEEIDLDKLINDWNSNTELENTMIETLGRTQATLVRYIANQGLQDLRAQEPVPAQTEVEPVEKKEPVQKKTVKSKAKIVSDK